MCFKHISSLALNLNPISTKVHCAHLDIIVMFSGLAVCDLSLFGSTEEPVAHLTKESRLWGQELHTCGKRKKEEKKKQQELKDWLTVTTENSRCDHGNGSMSHQQACVGRMEGEGGCR